jgi:hypothetical protein
LRFRDVRQLKAFGILDENVSPSRKSKISSHGSLLNYSPEALWTSSVAIASRNLGAEKDVPDRSHPNCHRDQADRQEKQNRRPPFRLPGLGRRFDDNSVLFRDHGENL